VVTTKTRVNIEPLPITSSEFLESLSLWVHPKSRLLICFDENCRHAISPNGSHPTNHLRDKHNIPLTRRKGLSKVLAKLELKSPDGAAPLLDGSPQERRLRQSNHGPTANIQTTVAAGSATTYAEQWPWLERTRWKITYRNRDRSLHRCLI
jgi:hypothetical protein